MPNSMNVQTNNNNNNKSKISNSPTSIVVFGASGDLAKKKTYPALFKLYKNHYLPQKFLIIGYARSKLDIEDFRTRVTEKIKTSSDEDKALLKKFRSALEYHHGGYDESKSFKDLQKRIEQFEKDSGCTEKSEGNKPCRIYYLALPPSQFYPVSQELKENVYSDQVVNRLIVEKPFGRDLESSNKLASQLGPLFTEAEIFRIDHYLGKEMVKNLLVLKFANVFFSGVWNRHYIDNVQITFKETFGSEGRGGYFDEYGIIRDVIQNHLLQVLSVVAMGRPVDLNGESIRDEKVRVLKSIPPIRIEDCVLGQYVKSADGSKPGYQDDKTVPDGSKCPTYAAVVMYVQNDTWADVPFIVKAGKALNETKSEVRIQFSDVPGSLFPNISRNELVIRVQPNEAIYMKMMNKKPGLGMETTISELDLSYDVRYSEAQIPDAYESLILDVLNGEKTNFVRDDELEAAWKIFTPLLHKIEKSGIEPKKYEYGSRGPEGVDEFVKKYGFVRHQQEYQWSPVTAQQKNKL
ncbi:hypothetical protein MP228_004853 [Amoeboaphelidium protococcarum]|nr:hypothetical protein MP228_004853 [Amoeboaphelidium protococcarum]